jgi:glycosyltransferase involved in cell wall biosynthesis
MGKKNKKSKVDKDVNLPFITICTPTFNRRPFIPIMIKCFEHQTYPKDKIEWIIVDDGTDKIEDLIKHIPQIKYFKYDEKLSLGKKRNIANDNSTGEIIIFMDDDDYYPPERFSHAVDTLLKNPDALCAGSSAMFIYFKHINKMYQFGPYAPNHATAATFAFKRELLKQTRFNELSCVAEEKQFLKDYTIPFVQLESLKSILVFSHVHNSFDKKELLAQMPNPHVHETVLKASDIVKEPELLKFFTVDIDILLSKYDFGNTKHKPDVVKQLAEIKKTRDEMMNKQIAYQNSMQLLNNPQILQSKINDLTNTINYLTIENSELKDKVQYLDNKIKQIITDHIQKKKSVKDKEDDQTTTGPTITIV